VDAATKAKILAAIKSGNGELVKALQSKLDGLVGRDSGYLDSLPEKVRCLAARASPANGARHCRAASALSRPNTSATAARTAR
jgi:hypothetical protein